MSFDKHFQKHFAAHVLRDGDFLGQVQRDLRPDFFADETLKRLVHLCLEYFKQHRAAPDILIFQFLDSWRSRELITVEQHKLCSTLADDLFAIQLQNRSFLLHEFDRFIKHQMFCSAAPDITEAFRRGDIEHAQNLVKKVFSYRSSRTSNLGRDYASDPTERIRRREQQDAHRFWTLIPELDEDVDGLGVGEIGLLLSQRTSGGKSAALGFLARSAAVQGMKSLIFTLEMTEEQYEDRLDQTIAGLRKPELKDSAKIETAVSKLFRRGGGIRIVSLPAYRTKVSHLRETTEMLRQVHNFHPDLILLDYADLLAPETDSLRGDLYAIGAETFSCLLGWMQEEKLRVWTASQSGRNTTEKSHAGPEDVAGSIAKTQIAQIVVSINRTPQEEMENKLRLHIGKNRDGKARFDKIICSDFSRMQFWKHVAEDGSPRTLDDQPGATP